MAIHQAPTERAARSCLIDAHLAEVGRDPDNGHAPAVRYTRTNGFGVPMHSTLTQGQVHAGVTQALTEHAVFDKTRSLLSVSAMEYALPQTNGLPFMGFPAKPVPLTGNPIGMKGCDKAGSDFAQTAVAKAVFEALAGRSVTHMDMTFTPLRVWQMLQRTCLSETRR